ncbi:hypothetical protein J4E81_011022 [Alternaria sp. BMP 2799]|nr:hypothetical protein J4E81_011022 [Alternaria sp. BMP 2799]
MTCAATSRGCGIEELKKKKEERAEKKRQRKEVRDEAKADTKAKLPDTTSKKAKLRLYITLLKLSYSGGDSGIDYIPQGGSSSSSRPLTAEERAERDRKRKEEQEEYERKRAEKKEKKQQRRAVRAETATAVKAKRHEAAKLKEKIRLTATLLTLKLHL